MTDEEQFAQLMGGENCHACGACGKMPAKWAQPERPIYSPSDGDQFACSPKCAWGLTKISLLWHHASGWNSWYKVTRWREGHSYDGLVRKAHYAFRKMP